MGLKRCPKVVVAAALATVAATIPTSAGGGALRDGDSPSSATFAPVATSSASAEVLFTRRLTGKSPFVGRCGDQGDGEPIVDSEVEVHLAVSPRDADHLVTTWQQDRYNQGGGARSVLAAVSTDGGASWTTKTLPGISSCTDPGNPLTRSTDPWTAIGPERRTYLASLPFTNNEGAVPNDAEQVSVSANGGFAWKPPVAVDLHEHLLEKEVIAADPIRSGSAYMVYEVLEESDGGTARGFTRFSRTTDGGKSWSPPIVVGGDAPGTVQSPVGGIVASPRPDGGTTLVVIQDRMDASTRDPPQTGQVTYASIRSDDLGKTWSEPSPIVTYLANGVRGDVESLSAIQSGAPSLARAPDGTLYVAWAQTTETGTAPGGTDIRIVRSRDAGTTWTPPRTISSIVSTAAMATVAVAGDGTVGVLWYDARRDLPGDGEFTMDVRFAWSTDEGTAWKERHLAGPFDMRQAPRDSLDPNGTGRWFLGDYAGLVGLPDGFAAMYPMAPPVAKDGPSDVFFTKIRVAPTLG